METAFCGITRREIEGWWVCVNGVVVWWGGYVSAVIFVIAAAKA